MKLYFKNLDGLRFIAALMVILQHVSEYKTNTNTALSNVFKEPFSVLGAHGVSLFFVLSGFLIFFLLFKENEIKGKVNVKNFYVRRILRIWPLYFGFGIIMILCIDFIFSLIGTSLNTPAATNLLYLFTFSINFQLLFAAHNKGIIELYWSVCIEEQFYLIAPWLIKKNRLLIMIISLIGIGIGSRLLLYYLQQQQIWNIEDEMMYFFTLCRLDNFGYGALAAYCFFKENVFLKVKKYTANYFIQSLVIVFVLLYISNYIVLPYTFNLLFSPIMISVLFGYIILAASTGKFIVNLEYNILKLLGKYSYGIYIFHAMVSQIVLLVFMKVFSNNGFWVYDVLLPVSCVVATAIVAGLSYELYEKWFLKLKDKFAVIRKG